MAEWRELLAVNPRDATLGVLLAVGVGSLRREQKLEQKKLSAMAGVTRTILSHVETNQGNPTLATIKKIAIALETTEMGLLRHGQIFLGQHWKGAKK